jgi:hypothetical protein
MRTLNRPMFRYGGPIKEGIMDGIREPKKNGGTIAGGNQIGMPMGNRTGFANPKKIKSDIIVGGTKNIVRKYAPKLEGIGGRTFDKLKNFYNRNTTKIPKYNYVDDGYMIKETPMLQRAMQFAKANPKQTAAGVGVGASSGLLENVVGGGLDLAGRGIMQAGDLLVSDKYFDQDKYMKENFPDGLFGGKKKTVEADELTADQLEIKRLNDLLGKKDDVPIVPKKTEKEIRDEQMSKYEKIMDIKGMKKDAAYNSLIAASQLINSEGDFKGSLKDGSLISKLIASTSKAYDKPANTRDALKSLLAKAEIEKDINLTKGNASTQSITALANASGRSEKYIANAKLQIPNSPGEAVAQLAKLNSGALTSDKVTAVISNYASENGIPFKQQITTEEKLEKVGKGKDYSTVVEFVNDLTLDPGGANDGLYVVGTSVVQVTDGVAKLKG